MHLKRPREGTPTKSAGGDKTNSVTTTSTPISSNEHHHNHNAKRSGNSSSNDAASKTTSTDTYQVAQKVTINATSTANTNTISATASAPAAYSTSTTASSPPQNNGKIIVNQFHASSLLNGHQLEEKEKILTQNGLATKNTSATAYEASFYAANYLNTTTDARNGSSNTTSNGITPHSNTKEDSSNFVGVSLANQANINGIHEENADDDDPSSGNLILYAFFFICQYKCMCSSFSYAAIDVVTDTDSDYDEDYTGEPFRLKEDADETLQSKTSKCNTHRQKAPIDI